MLGDLSEPLLLQNPLEKVGGEAPPFSNDFAVVRGRLDPNNQQFLARKHVFLET